MITINQLLKLDRRCRLLIQCPTGTREVSTLDLADALEARDYDRVIPTKSFDISLPNLDVDFTRPKFGTIKATARPDILDVQAGTTARTPLNTPVQLPFVTRLPGANDIAVRTPSGIYLPSTDIIRLPGVIGDSIDIRMPSPSDYAHPMSLLGLDDYDRVIVTNDLGKPGKYQAKITTISPSGSPIQSTLLTESLGKSSWSKGFSSGLKGQGLYLVVDAANSVYQAWLDGKVQTIADVATELQKYVEQIPESYLQLAEEIVVSAVTNNADRLLPALAELTPIPLAARVADSVGETIERATGLERGLTASQQLDLVYDYILDRPTGVKIGGSLEDGTVTITESFGKSPDRITTYSAKDAAGNNLVSNRDWLGIVTHGSIVSDSSTGNKSTNPIAKVVDGVSSAVQDVVTSPYSTPYGAVNKAAGGALDRALNPIRTFVQNIFD